MGLVVGGGGGRRRGAISLGGVGAAGSRANPHLGRAASLSCSLLESLFVYCNALACFRNINEALSMVGRSTTASIGWKGIGREGQYGWVNEE